MSKKAIIIGAGPAGLTAAFELLERTDYIPLIFEATSDIGGISKTVNYKGNRMDIGGHRFFSKSKRVMDWWLQFMPIEQASLNDFITLTYHGRTANINTQSNNQSTDPDQVMLVRNRKSRIYFLRKFFDYPIALNLKTLANLGPVRIAKITASYIFIRLFPIKNERSLEDFFINRFGKELYLTFFKDYTEKVWGLSCKEIKPEWGAQRVKGLSVSKAVFHALKKMVKPKGKLAQKNTQTSLIEQFLYPKFGPGQLWEAVAKKIELKGGKIYFNRNAIEIAAKENKIISVNFKNTETGAVEYQTGDLFFSTMPVKDLINAFQPPAPQNIHIIANGLQYRDFITVGLLVKKMQTGGGKMIADNWIYIQEKEVKIGRLQIFNNWSPALVANPENVWLGLEYFCNEGDELWNTPDDEFKTFAARELERIGMIDTGDVLDSTVIRVRKTYPSYTGSYDQIAILTHYTDTFENLFLIGRNGMHKYNNQDHSMLTAMTAVDNIIEGRKDKSNIWSINTEEEYHEEE